MIVAWRLLVEWPKRLALPLPDVVGERVLECIDHRFDTVVDISQGLMRIEVAACPSEVLIFEETLLARFLVEQKIERWGDKLGDLPVNFIVAFPSVSILSKQGVEESLGAIEVSMAVLKCIGVPVDGSRLPVREAFKLKYLVWRPYIRHKSIVGFRTPRSVPDSSRVIVKQAQGNDSAAPTQRYMAVRRDRDCVSSLPLHWLAIVSDDSVVLEVEEECPAVS
jgi:hypothetical protein